jgi:hypothetical protein
MLDSFHSKYIKNTSRTFAFVSADHQVWIKMWKQRIEKPLQYSWLIPLPGDWHTTWHILKGIFRLYGQHILLPFSIQLGFKSLDLECNNFHYGEDLLQIVTLATMKWMQNSMRQLAILDPLEWLKRLKPNSIAYELAYACLWYFIPYWVTRSALKWNKGEVEVLWRYWLHLFIATNKKHYALMSLRFLWILHSLHPAIRNVYNNFRVFSNSGKEGTGVPLDGWNELVCHQFT